MPHPGMCVKCGERLICKPQKLCSPCWKEAGKPRATKQAAELAPRSDAEPGLPSHLAAMRWVTEQDEKLDDTPLKKAVRSSFSKNPAKFIEDKGHLERAWLEEAVTPQAEVIEQEPPSLEMIDEWNHYQEWLKHRERFLAWLKDHAA